MKVHRLYITLDGDLSNAVPLNFEVPQGSVHSPLPFNIDMLTLGGIIRRFGFDYHIYMDDTQIYLPIPVDSIEVLSWLITCLSEIQAWMTFNFSEA